MLEALLEARLRTSSALLKDRRLRGFDVTKTSKLGAPGFGTGRLYGGASRGASLSLLHAAWDAGVRWFDTAPLYGHGDAESILGDALVGRRADATIVTKVGIEPVRITLGYRFHAHFARLAAKVPGVGRVLAPPAPLQPRFHVFSPEAVRTSVERSLKALRTDCIDLLLLHECTPQEAEDASVLEVLDTLKQSGKIKAHGIATSYEASARIAVRPPTGMEACQFPFHLDGPPPAQAGVALIVHSVLGPRITQLERLLAADAAARARASALGIDPDAPDLAKRLLAAAARIPEVAAVLFSTSRPERIAALVGANEISQLEATAGLEFARWAISASPVAIDRSS